LHLAHTAVRQRLLGQSRRNFFDLAFDVLYRHQRILTVAHHHYAADGLGAPLVECSAPERRSSVHARNVFHIDRNMVMRCNYSVFYITQLFDKTDAAYDVFDAVYFNRTRTHIAIGHAHSFKDLGDGNAVGAHGIRVDINLILLHKTTDRSHFTHALSAQQ